MNFVTINDLLYSDSLSQYLSSLHLVPYNFGFIKSNYAISQNDMLLANYKLVFMLEGSAQILIGNNTYSIYSNDIILIPPLIRYSLISKKNKISHYYLYFDCDNQTLLPFKKGLNIYRNLLDEYDMDLLHHSYQLIQKTSIGRYFIVESMLKWFIYRLKQSNMNLDNTIHFNYNQSHGEIVTRACDYIDQHIHENIKIEDICLNLGVSQSYLYTCFIKVFNVSSKTFLDTYKLHQIELDLIQSDCSIIQIANNYGYTNVYAFSSLFKKYYDQSPLNYRKNIVEQRPINNNLETSSIYLEKPSKKQ